MAPKPSIGQPETRFAFIGGAVCLDFANTVGGIRGGHAHEHLTRYLDLVRWSQQSQLVAESEAEMLVRKAEHDREDATAVLSRAYALREAIYHIFTALISETQPAESDIENFNREL